MNMKKGFYPASTGKKTMSDLFKKAPANPANLAKKLGTMPKTSVPKISSIPTAPKASFRIKK